MALLPELTPCWLREMQPDSHVDTIAIALIIHPFNIAAKCQLQTPENVIGLDCPGILQSTV